MMVPKADLVENETKKTKRNLHVISRLYFIFMASQKSSWKKAYLHINGDHLENVELLSPLAIVVCP